MDANWMRSSWCKRDVVARSRRRRDQSPRSELFRFTPRKGSFRVAAFELIAGVAEDRVVGRHVGAGDGTRLKKLSYEGGLSGR